LLAIEVMSGPDQRSAVSEKQMLSAKARRRKDAKNISIIFAPLRLCALALCFYAES
jgi:hypothetical protein